jgi:hypothetical protein
VLSFPLDKRRTLIRKELRKNLFNLFAGWAGRFGQIFGFNTRPANGPNGPCTEFEFSALQVQYVDQSNLTQNFDTTQL